ncbi:hypothetical protein M9H77_23189 [Catharanthus roseus]|uniref:Uncharacterized protein n=1 Tax=Catharanthus roseus TaxID=4058 RepID=A0ACC0AT07_CATRO|nr:hypothetical protein M9H77_23189 [Catharanthus roseus]
MEYSLGAAFSILSVLLPPTPALPSKLRFTATVALLFLYLFLVERERVPNSERAREGHPITEGSLFDRCMLFLAIGVSTRLTDARLCSASLLASVIGLTAVRSDSAVTDIASHFSSLNISSVADKKRFSCLLVKKNSWLPSTAKKRIGTPGRSRTPKRLEMLTRGLTPSRRGSLLFHTKYDFSGMNVFIIMTSHVNVCLLNKSTEQKHLLPLSSTLFTPSHLSLAESARRAVATVTGGQWRRTAVDDTAGRCTGNSFSLSTSLSSSPATVLHI